MRAPHQQRCLEEHRLVVSMFYNTSILLIISIIEHLVSARAQHIVMKYEYILQLGIPFAVIATPFAGLENGDDAVPCVDMGESPPRCLRCGGYVNPSVTWKEGGNKWDCNLCGVSNVTPPWYFSSLDGSGQRIDRKARLELSRGAVDYLVSGAYCTRPPQEPIFVFVVDISKRAHANGSSLASLRAVKAAVKGHAFKEGVKVGMITFDESINFYRVSVGPSALADSVSVLVVDRNDPVPALPLNSWLFPIGKSYFSFLCNKLEGFPP